MNIDTHIPVTLFGFGRVGATLHRLLVQRGFRVDQVIDPSLSQTTDRGRAHVLPGLSPDILSRPCIVLLCIPDASIRDTARDLAEACGDMHGMFVAHTSGASGAAVLEGAREAGALTAMVHPLQSFPRADLPLERVSSIPCGIQAEDDARPTAHEFAQALGWKPFDVRADRVALYHAACALAGNTLPAILSSAGEMISSATDGMCGPDTFIPMTESVIAEMRASAAWNAITGPVSRGDVATLRAHVDALSRTHPELLPAYRAAAEIIMHALRLDEGAMELLRESLGITLR